MRSLLWFLKTVILFGLIILLIYGIAVIAGAMIPASFGQEPADPENTDASIYLIHNGYHVEICLPADEAPVKLTDELKKIRPDIYAEKEPAYYSFGWGDKTFYPGTPTLSEFNLYNAVRALILPTQAAMRISWYYGPLRETSRVTRIPVTEAQTDRLYRYINSTYMYDSRAEVKLLTLPAAAIDPAYTDSIFVEATGTYSLIYTSNNWTNQAIKRAGIPTSLWTPTVWGVGN